MRAEAQAAVNERANEIFVSAVSAWEIAIKRGKGRLDAPRDLRDRLAVSEFIELPITVSHALAVEALPPHHGDPFDRLLVAQAREEGLTLVSRDPRIARYEVPLLAA